MINSEAPHIVDVLDPQEEYLRLRNAAENMMIAYGMGWDMDGVITVLKTVLEDQS